MEKNIHRSPQELTKKDLIAYLRLQNNQEYQNVRKIIRFQPFEFDQTGIAVLNYHGPRYTEACDCGYGFLDRDGFRLDSFSPIRMATQIPVGNYQYYAIGFPRFRYLSTVRLGNLVGAMRLAPFTVTRSEHKSESLSLILKDGFVSHNAPSAKGMSGGPIIRYDRDTIEVLGVVQGAFVSDNGIRQPRMCGFWRSGEEDE